MRVDEGRGYPGGRIHKPATTCLLFSGGGGRRGGECKELLSSKIGTETNRKEGYPFRLRFASGSEKIIKKILYC